MQRTATEGATDMLTTTTDRGLTTIEHPELGPVAKYWRQGNWQVRLAIGPDEWVASDPATGSGWATRETAETIALRHAEAL